MLKINRILDQKSIENERKSIENVWYEACFHMTIGHYLFMQEAELSSPNKGAKE